MTSDQRTRCPTCDEGFDTETDMKIHHKLSHGESIAGVEKPCEQCGEPFRRCPSLAERGRFCSQECWQLNQRNRIAITCEGCGVVFEVVESKASSRRFCSNECRRNRIEKTCPGCGGAYEVTASMEGQFRYCSTECRSEDRTIELECENCGEVFENWASESNHQRFCSRDCYLVWARRDSPSMDCEVCGVEFLYRPSKEGYRRFCSKKCHHRAMRMGLDPIWENPYGQGWDEGKREEIREREGRQCWDCKRDESEFNERLHVHHIVPADTIDDATIRNSSTNLVALCRGCHKKWESAAAPSPPGMPLPDDCDPPTPVETVQATLEAA